MSIFRAPIRGKIIVSDLMNVRMVVLRARVCSSCKVCWSWLPFWSVCTHYSREVVSLSGLPEEPVVMARSPSQHCRHSLYYYYFFSPLLSSHVLTPVQDSPTLDQAGVLIG